MWKPWVVFPWHRSAGKWRLSLDGGRSARTSRPRTNPLQQSPSIVAYGWAHSTGTLRNPHRIPQLALMHFAHHEKQVSPPIFIRLAPKQDKSATSSALTASVPSLVRICNHIPQNVLFWCYSLRYSCCTCSNLSFRHRQGRNRAPVVPLPDGQG